MKNRVWSIFRASSVWSPYYLLGIRREISNVFPLNFKYNLSLRMTTWSIQCCPHFNKRNSKSFKNLPIGKKKKEFGHWVGCNFKRCVLNHSSVLSPGKHWSENIQVCSLVLPLSALVMLALHFLSPPHPISGQTTTYGTSLVHRGHLIGILL